MAKYRIKEVQYVVHSYGDKDFYTKLYYEVQRNYLFLFWLNERSFDMLDDAKNYIKVYKENEAFKSRIIW
jgi:hypothetical protein